jgi:hypothetical protein
LRVRMPGCSTVCDPRHVASSAGRNESHHSCMSLFNPHADARYEQHRTRPAALANAGPCVRISGPCCASLHNWHINRAHLSANRAFPVGKRPGIRRGVCDRSPRVLIGCDDGPLEHKKSPSLIKLRCQQMQMNWLWLDWATT